MDLVGYTRDARRIFDLDYFKNVNDNYGHMAGDLILKQMGEILRENKYPLDIAGRYGGEEFIMLMPFQLLSL